MEFRLQVVAYILHQIRQFFWVSIQKNENFFQERLQKNEIQCLPFQVNFPLHFLVKNY